MYSITSHSRRSVFNVFALLLGLQCDEMEGGAVSDEDFQNRSVLTNRKPAVERQRVQKGKAKVCVATGGSARNLKLKNIIRDSLIFFI